MLAAFAVLAVGMLILTASLANSLRPLALAKQRAAATAAAQEMLEVARSLSWNDVGLVATDTTLPQNGGVDAAIVNASGTWKFGSGCSLGTPCEPLQYATNSAGHPFNPHTQTITRGPTTITRSAYVTGQDTNGDGIIDLKRVTVRATFLRAPIQGVSSTVRLTTLISSAQFGGGSGAGAGFNGVPLTATSTAKNGGAMLSAAVGAGAIATPTLLNLTNPFADHQGILTVRNTVSCTARAHLLDVPGGSTFGPAATSTLADDDPLTATAQTDGPTSSNWPGNGMPGDISPWVAQASLAGTQTCLSTVLGPDGVAGNDDDLPYGSGSAAGASATTLQQNAAPAVPALGIVQLLSMGTSTASGTVDAGPVNAIVSSATQSAADTKVMVVNAPTLPTPILATNGLLRIQSFTATATAAGQQSGTPAAPSVSSGSMTIWIYDPFVQIPVGPNGCTSRSVAPNPLNYCIITRTYTSPFSLSLTVGIPEVLSPTIRYTVTITAGIPSLSTTTTSKGTTWEARLTPMTASVRLCATTAADCPTAAGKVLDLKNDIDFGSILARVVKGFP